MSQYSCGTVNTNALTFTPPLSTAQLASFRVTGDTADRFAMFGDGLVYGNGAGTNPAWFTYDPTGNGKFIFGQSAKGDSKGALYAQQLFTTDTLGLFIGTIGGGDVNINPSGTNVKIPSNKTILGNNNLTITTSAGTVVVNNASAISAPSTNGIAIIPTGSAPTYQNSAVGNLALGTGTTFNGTTNCISIGNSPRTLNNRTGTIVVQTNTTTLGSPGADRTLEMNALGSIWLTVNTAGNLGQTLNLSTGAWQSISDAKTKQIHGVLSAHPTSAKLQAGRTITDALASFELFSYNYHDTDIEHLDDICVGPTTQSFYGSFGEFIGKKAKKHVYSGAWDENGKCVSKCLQVGDEYELLDDRDEKTTMWLTLKAMNEEIRALKAEVAILSSTRS